MAKKHKKKKNKNRPSWQPEPAAKPPIEIPNAWTNKKIKDALCQVGWSKDSFINPVFTPDKHIAKGDLRIAGFFIAENMLSPTSLEKASMTYNSTEEFKSAFEETYAKEPTRLGTFALIKTPSKTFGYVSAAEMDAIIAENGNTVELTHTPIFSPSLRRELNASLKTPDDHSPDGIEPAKWARNSRRKNQKTPNPPARSFHSPVLSEDFTIGNKQPEKEPEDINPILITQDDIISRKDALNTFYEVSAENPKERLCIPISLTKGKTHPESIVHGFLVREGMFEEAFCRKKLDIRRHEYTIPYFENQFREQYKDRCHEDRLALKIDGFKTYHGRMEFISTGLMIHMLEQGTPMPEDIEFSDEFVEHLLHSQEELMPERVKRLHEEFNTFVEIEPLLKEKCKKVNQATEKNLHFPLGDGNSLVITTDEKVLQSVLEDEDQIKRIKLSDVRKAETEILKNIWDNLRDGKNIIVTNQKTKRDTLITIGILNHRNELG